MPNDNCQALLRDYRVGTGPNHSSQSAGEIKRWVQANEQKQAWARPDVQTGPGPFQKDATEKVPGAQEENNWSFCFEKLILYTFMFVIYVRITDILWVTHIY